jgi:hypothetical protein
VNTAAANMTREIVSGAPDTLIRIQRIVPTK